jgi:microcystin-dependent protein
MADTYTNTLGVILMGIGGDNNTWGTNLNNSVFQIFEDAIVNLLTTTAAGGQIGPANTLDLSASPPPAGPTAARYRCLGFVGAVSADQTVIVPNLQKQWLVTNALTGGFKLKFKTPSGTAVTIPAGSQEVVCTGGNAIVVSPFNWTNILMPDGAAAAPSHSYANEPGSGWYRAGTQDVRLAVNGADVLQVTGAGASTPSVVNLVSPETLQVAGVSAGVFTTGDVKLTFKTVADSGWVMMNDSTIGDASSNATYANANASALFQLLYNNIADADAPITTSGGAATTRGAQGAAATAFANHCRLALPLALGRALAVAGGGAGLTARALGHALGEETHLLSASEIPAHTHSGTTGGESADHTHTVAIASSGTLGGGGLGNFQTAMVPGGSTTTSGRSAGHTHGFTTDNGTGGGGAHNNMQATTFLNVMIKL